MGKVRLYDFERICVDAVRWTGQNFVNDTSINRAFKVVVKINGRVNMGGKNNRMNMRVTDEIIEFRLLTLSNYKSVFVKYSESLWNFMFQDINTKDQFIKERFEHSKDFWYKNAHHDSCWTEGFSLTRMFDYDSTFEVIEMGLGKSTYIPDTNAKNFLGFYSDYDKREKALLSELTDFISWKISTESDWDFWNSFMKEMSMGGYAKGFRLQFTNTSGDKFKEKSAHVSYDNKGNGNIVTKTENRKNKEVRLYVNPFTKEVCNKIFKDMNLNFVFDDFYTFSEYVDMYSKDGWKTIIKYPNTK